MSSFPRQTWRCSITHQLASQPIQLPPTESTSLLQLIQAHRTPQVMAKRAQIIVTAHAHPNWSSPQLAQSLGLKARLIRKWRRRWSERHSLQDASRSGAPRRFSSEMRAQVTALACSLPPSHGVPLAHWSRVELARYVAHTPSLPEISSSTIGRWLVAEQIRPWRHHSWQHIQNPELFLLRARPVLQLYEQATSFLKEGIWVICVDEKTSIQARQAEQQPRPAIRKHPVYQSPRYLRHGALHLMAALSVADGLIYGQCSPRKRFIDFRSFLETVVVVEARRRQVQTIALVLDTGPTHAPKHLPSFAKELETTSEGKLTMQLYWLPTNASWLDQIEIWFSLLQRKLLRPNHFSSLDELESALQNFMIHYNQAAKPIKWSYTIEQLERKLGTNLR
jgi:hypothetical protein